MTPGKAPSAYARAGVDLEAAQQAKERIKKLASSTFGPGVLSDIGLFGGLFQVQGFRQPVLVSSVDGVGTKLRLATLLNRHQGVGHDLVNHCVNDILTLGACPLFFLDYIAMGKLVPDRVEKIVAGIVAACQEVGCALVGGETAEMPGIYHGEDYDLVGFIVGAVERGEVKDGRDIAAGDILLGLPSSGLHTNGYSLVRQAFELEGAEAISTLNHYYAELGRTLGEALLEPHRGYYQLIQPVLPRVKGLAHITGGGLVENLPRILPPGLAARIEKKTWSVPPLFGMIQHRGQVSNEEMFRVFNMGVGMVVVVSPEQERKLLSLLPGAWRLGQVVSGERRVMLD